MAFHIKVGKLGESIAKEYLQKNGYKIIEQNYRTKYAEIDLVAVKENVLVFVEVRTKTGELLGTPEESINRRKRAKLVRNAASYMARKRNRQAYRIDAVCVVLNKDSTVSRIDHYENITF